GGEWELAVDGAPVRRGRLPALGDGLEVQLDLDTPAAGERFVTFRFFLRRTTEWAPAGHEVAWQQFPLRSRARRGSLRRGSRPPAVDGEAGGRREPDAVGGRPSPPRARAPTPPEPP